MFMYFVRKQRVSHYKQPLKMNKTVLKSASSHSLFQEISENAEYYRRKMTTPNSSKGKWYKYTDTDNNSQEISFQTNSSVNVELSLKINGCLGTLGQRKRVNNRKRRKRFIFIAQI